MIPKNAYAHFYGGNTVNIDKYEILFVPYPTTPTIVSGNNNNSSITKLNFSVLENNSNIYNIYSALIIMKKGSDPTVIAQYPYKLYEFSDITIPYAFNETGDYKIMLSTRIQGDPKYQAQPLEASFDLSVVSPFQAMLSDQNVWIPLIAIPIVGACAGIAIYAWKKM